MACPQIDALPDFVVWIAPEKGDETYRVKAGLSTHRCGRTERRVAAIRALISSGRGRR